MSEGKAEAAPPVEASEGKDAGKDDKLTASGAPRRRFYTPAEVGTHNGGDDCWVSIFFKVYELTGFLEANPGPLAQPIIDYAGEDISHWFDEQTGDVKTKVDQTTNLELPHLPFGRFAHVPPPEPVSDWATDFGTPWWRVSVVASWVSSLEWPPCYKVSPFEAAFGQPYACVLTPTLPP